MLYVWLLVRFNSFSCCSVWYVLFTDGRVIILIGGTTLSGKDSESQRRERYMWSFRSVRLRVRLCRLSCGGALHAKVASRLCAPPRKERPLLLYGAKSNNRTVVELWLVWWYGYFKMVSDCVSVCYFSGVCGRVRKRLVLGRVRSLRTLLCRRSGSCVQRSVCAVTRQVFWLTFGANGKSAAGKSCGIIDQV